MSEVVRDIIWLPAFRPSMREILNRIAALHGLTRTDVISSRYSHKLAPIRQHAMWEMHARGYSNAQIARAFDLTNHTTVVKGRQRHERRLMEAQGRAA